MKTNPELWFCSYVGFGSIKSSSKGAVDLVVWGRVPWGTCDKPEAQSPNITCVLVGFLRRLVLPLLGCTMD